MSRRLTFAWLVAVVAVVFAGAAAATHISDNLVDVLNSTDHARASGSGVDVSITREDVVDNANRASAVSYRCTGCRTTAAAMQAVLITKTASTIVPTNVAIAANVECSSCESFAAAYQYVVTTEHPVRLSNAAELEIADIRREVARAVAKGVPFSLMQAELDALYARLKAVIDTEIERKGMSVEARSTRRSVDKAAA